MDDLTPDSPQDHLRTHHNPFGIRDAEDNPLFCITEGIRADDALAHASLLLKGAYETTYELTDIGLGHSGLLWPPTLSRRCRAASPASRPRPAPTTHGVGADFSRDAGNTVSRRKPHDHPGVPPQR
ncbi:hypothetical protein [Pseudomonas putida]